MSVKSDGQGLMIKWGKETGSEISVSFWAGWTPRQDGAMKASVVWEAYTAQVLAKPIYV